MQSDVANLTRLLEAIAVNNDKLAFKSLYFVLYPKLKVFINGFLKNSELSEELADDVMVTLWRNRSTLLKVKNIKVYAFVIAKNLCLDHFRKGSLLLTELNDEIDFVASFDTPEQILVTQELKIKIEQGIDSLPNQCKLVFYLIKEESLTYKEAAEILNISVKTVDAHLVAALKKISIFLKKEYNLVR